MKAKIKQGSFGHYWWVIYESNGRFVAGGPVCSHKSSAMRGLKKFIKNFSSLAILELDKNSDLELICGLR